MFQKSTFRDLEDARTLKQRVIYRIQELKRQGVNVEIIWDVDHVLMDGRSDDVYAMVNDLDRYFAYEERLLLQVAYDGPWAEIATRVGELHNRQHIVTARSTMTTPRVPQFLMARGIRTERQYMLGSQSKGPSYKMTLENAFAAKPNSFVFMVDDSARHVDDFKEVAARLGLADQTEAIIGPRIRHYTPDELKAHYDAVMDDRHVEPWILTEGNVLGVDGPRYSFLVSPRGSAEYQRMLEKMQVEATERAIVDKCRQKLVEVARNEFPDREITNDFLLEIWRLRYR